MLSLKRCSGVWFTVAGTGSEETAIDNAASAGGGWNVPWAVTEGLLHVLEESVASNSWEGTDQDLPVPSCPDDLSCPSPPTSFPPPALLNMKSPQPKPSLSVYSFWEWCFFSSEWLVVQRQVQEQCQHSSIGSLLHCDVQEKYSSTTTVSLPFVALKIH